MFCKHCGMESTTPGVCSWCRHPLTAAATDRGVPSTAGTQAEVSDQPAAQPNVSDPFAAQAAAQAAAAQAPSAPAIPGADDAQRPIIGVRGKPQIRPVPPPGHVPVGAPIPRPVAPPQPLARPVPPPAAPQAARPVPAAPVVPTSTPTSSAAPVIPAATVFNEEPAAPAPAFSAPVPPAPAFTIDEDLPPLANVAPAAPAPRPPVQPMAAPAPSPAPVDVQPYQQAAPVMPVAPVPPPPRQAPAMQPVAQAAPTVLPHAAMPAAVSPVPPPPRAAASPTGRAYPSGKQPLNAEPEPEPEEVVGLASGVSASARPNMPSSADMHIQAALSGTNGMVQSKYYSGQMVDTISGTQYDAATGAVTSAAQPAPAAGNAQDIIFHWDDPDEAAAPMLGKFASIFVMVLVVCGLVANFLPDAWVAPLCISTFLGGMLLPVFRVIPWQDEDSDDAVILLLLTLTMGPAVGLACYCVICLIRQEWNSSAIGCMGVAVVSRIVMELCAKHGFSLPMVNVPWVQPPPAATPEESVSLPANIMICYTALLAMAGWYIANVFHKADE
jgi:hypothetical protein